MIVLITLLTFSKAIWIVYSSISPKITLKLLLYYIYFIYIPYLKFTLTINLWAFYKAMIIPHFNILYISKVYDKQSLYTYTLLPFEVFSYQYF